MTEVTPIPKAKKKARQGSAMVRADRVCAQYVKKRDGYACVNCGSTSYIQWAHLYSRSYKAIRCDPANSVTLCRSCHMNFTKRPLEWQDWCKERFGEGHMLALKRRALAGGRNDWKQIEADLKQRLEGL